MTERNAFGLEVEPEEETAVEETEVPESITSESLSDEAAVAEGSPSQEQPRDERGRFASQEAPEVDPAAEPEVETPQEPAELDEDDPWARWLAAKPEELADYKFANKWDDPREAERGYNESREMWRRANEARKVEAQERMALQEQYSALYRQMEQAIPVLQQAAQRETAYREFAEKYKAQYGDYPEGYTPPAPQPAPGPQDIQAIVDQRLAQERQVWAAQAAEQQEYEALSSAVSGFYRDHPDLQPPAGEQFGPADLEIAQARDVLDASWDRYGIEIDPTDRGSLEILYEASQDAALLEVLKLNPQYFESELGMTLARRDAAVISGRVPATTETKTERVPASQVKASGGKKPFQEAANVGASAPATEDESDPWVRIQNAKLIGDAGSPGKTKSVFFE